jgi:hypothetical protein
VGFGKEMSELDEYLKSNYLSTEQFACACGISIAELNELIQLQLIPEPSYTVTENSTVKSHAFGEMSAPGSTPGCYFHPGNRTWVEIARRAEFKHDPEALKDRFARNFSAALLELDKTTWRLTDSFDDNGEIIYDGLQSRIEKTWRQFLLGTFGLCVAKPTSEKQIARKEILQEKLTSLTENGSRHANLSIDQNALLELIDQYAASSMPFSPIEYPHSSRKRLVDDLKEKIAKA